MASTPIKRVLAVCASGNVGRSTVKVLLEEDFQVSGLTRESSKATLPAVVKHVKSDYSEASLLEAFKGQDAVVSTISSITPGDAMTLRNLLSMPPLQRE
ncbi:hypothetical protein IFM51744_08752 [Aspergillus udagawae]|uniref:NAD(P)-binding domain-containing protein n=1 Tax=Aspergillus udagawae TaxID=91492 RepID=A0ABQ1AAF7_9EURO|nr:hypothetical protein IFM51744_08752 [Aspergillus udagawae]GFF77453.1 hypothetical protein IFM53868_02091 [Aspergillus udagawae]GFG17507.1 hypothetical protein IFM5058_08510 [Aspergillus udagawae]